MKKNLETATARMFQLDLLESQRCVIEKIGRRRIEFGEEINETSVRQIADFLDFLNRRGKEEIILQIFSQGGDVDSGFRLYEIIRNSPSPITGLAYEANSMAIVVLQACAKRQANKGASFQFHNIHWKMVFREKVSFNPNWEEFMEELACQTRRDWEKIAAQQARYYEIIARRMNIDPGFVEALCREKRCLNAKQAHQFGLIDEIT